MTKLGLGPFFRVTNDNLFFFDKADVKFNMSSADEIREEIIKPIESEFGRDMLRLTPKYKVICKYKGCPYKISYTPNDFEKEEGSDILTYKLAQSIKCHSIEAHQSKVERGGIFL